MPYPTSAQLLAKFSAEGFTVPAGFDAAGAIAAAIDWWERETGFIPFLNESLAVTTRTYNAPGPFNQALPSSSGGKQVLALDGGLLGAPTITVAGSASAITTLVEGTSFWRVLRNNKWPCLAIRFAIPIYGIPNGVSVTGPFGFCSVLPDQAFAGILAYACYQGFLDLQASTAGPGAQGLVEQRVGDVVKKWGDHPLGSFGDSMLTKAKASLASFKRPVGIQ